MNAFMDVFSENFKPKFMVPFKYMNILLTFSQSSMVGTFDFLVVLLTAKMMSGLVHIAKFKRLSMVPRYNVSSIFCFLNFLFSNGFIFFKGANSEILYLSNKQLNIYFDLIYNHFHIL